MDYFKKLIGNDKKTDGELVMKGNYSFFIEVENNNQFINNSTIKINLYENSGRSTKIKGVFKWFRQISIII